MMLSFCCKDFSAVIWFLLQSGFGACVLQMIELKSAWMVSASSVCIPAKTVFILATRSTAGIVVGVIE